MSTEFSSQFSDKCPAQYLDKLQNIMNLKQATVFSTTYCSYCTKAKKLLQNNEIAYNEVMLDEMQQEDAE